MASSSTAPAIPTFNGLHYHIWAVKMKTYLKSQGLWKVVETDKDPPALRANPTVAQLKNYEEELLKKDKALTCLHSGLADQIFTSIMDLDTPKAVWDKIQDTYEGSDRVKAVRLLTLRREFELLKMNDDELVKDYSSRIMDVVNQIRLHGDKISDQKVVEKIMISVPQKFEAKISAIEESCDISMLTVSELTSKLQAQEQRVSMRSEEKVEGAFQASFKNNKAGNSRQNTYKRGNYKGNKSSNSRSSSSTSKKGTFPPCKVCQNTNHQEADCWFKDKPKFKCNFCKKFGHIEKYCRTKKNQCQTKELQLANVSEENQEVTEHLFMASHVDYKSRDVTIDEGVYWDWNMKEVKRHEASISNLQNESYYDDPEFDVEDTTDTEVLRTRKIDDVYESCNHVVMESESYIEASKHDEWNEAMKAELEMIKKNETWKLIDLPKDVDFGETLAPVARHDVIKLLLAVAAQRNLKIHHLDVKSAFLNAELVEEIYVKQPQGFEVAGQEDKVYRLYKALYGLKQAPRAWYSKIDAHLINHNFKRSPNESTLYVKQLNSQEVLIISLYVDDLLVIGSNDNLVEEFKKQMKSEFEMSDLGLMHYFLGMKINQQTSGVYISQKKYASDMLKRFNMFSCKPVTSPLVLNCKLSKEDGDKLADPTLYRSIIGSLLYLAISRPDLAYAASFLSRFMTSPTSSHLGAARRVLRYLKGSLDLGIMFERNKDVKLEGYSDSDWAGSVDDMKSTSGYVFNRGSGAFCWNSKKQSVVAQSTAEAEYIAIAAAVNHAVWIRKLLSDLDLTQDSPTVIYCDNKSAIAIAENPVQHGRTKHINVKYHVIREAEKNREVKLKYCTSDDQLADMLTKSLTGMKLDQLKTRLMMSNNNLKEESTKSCYLNLSRVDFYYILEHLQALLKVVADYSVAALDPSTMDAIIESPLYKVVEALGFLNPNLMKRLLDESSPTIVKVGALKIVSKVAAIDKLQMCVAGAAGL
ncbi:uncharacterized protein [Rutidosis leptorrhynchoides]|uniref:uncharacterized protein n=1 Tax=Rutidosis leptorrhynchoides TaxID=125765 RepID=UPI003A9A399A